jgi:hypothetical protein
VYRDDEDEVMHGVGQLLSSKSSMAHKAAPQHVNVSEGGDVVLEGACKKSYLLAQQEYDAWSSYPSFNQQISELFSKSATKKVRHGQRFTSLTHD